MLFQKSGRFSERVWSEKGEAKKIILQNPARIKPARIGPKTQKNQEALASSSVHSLDHLKGEIMDYLFLYTLGPQNIWKNEGFEPPISGS